MKCFSVYPVQDTLGFTWVSKEVDCPMDDRLCVYSDHPLSTWEISRAIEQHSIATLFLPIPEKIMIKAFDLARLLKITWGTILCRSDFEGYSGITRNYIRTSVLEKQPLAEQHTNPYIYFSDKGVLTCKVQYDTITCEITDREVHIYVKDKLDIVYDDVNNCIDIDVHSDLLETHIDFLVDIVYMFIGKSIEMFRDQNIQIRKGNSDVSVLYDYIGHEKMYFVYKINDTSFISKTAPDRWRCSYSSEKRTISSAIDLAFDLSDRVERVPE